MDARTGQQLAYYKTAQGLGVLAPRGWYCFGTYGSGGQSLYVSPRPIDASDFFSAKPGGFKGPIIQLRNSFGNTSGRFRVAAFIARLFPSRIAFIKDIKRAEPDVTFPSGPYPSDRLTYKSKTVVEYETPAQTDGLGTDSALEKDGSSIRGVTILVGRTPDLIHLAIRLPPHLANLTSVIIHLAEREALTYRE